MCAAGGVEEKFLGGETNHGDFPIWEMRMYEKKSIRRMKSGMETAPS